MCRAGSDIVTEMLCVRTGTEVRDPATRDNLTRAGRDQEPTGFGDCNGEGLGIFNFGDDDDVGAWDTSPRLSMVGSHGKIVNASLSKTSG